jgi:hypothetical protein
MRLIYRVALLKLVQSVFLSIFKNQLNLSNQSKQLLLGYANPVQIKGFMEYADCKFGIF